ncbi:MAG: DUF3134 domain-containing protein [Leptolyngbyaceae cyanobacterium MO_188.B28]|nr:DUF3134 domain-containing protein [Leptolyngbyaceae cyanobacterium MO_188.B28]
MKVKKYNPALRQEPRHQRAKVIPSRQNISILDWLDSQGRIIWRDFGEYYSEARREEILDEIFEEEQA